MTKTSLKIAFFALGLSALAASSSALADGWDRHGGYNDRGGWSHEGWGRDRYDNRDDNLDARIDQMRDRIDRGVRHGDLTRQEARRLNDELSDITRDERRAERSGRGIDREEAEWLNRRLNRLSDRVHYEKNDRDVAWDSPRHRY